MRPLHLLFVALLFLAAPHLAHAAPETPALRAQVHRLLSARHAPPDAAQLAALGPEGRQLLLELGADPKAHPWQRGRALLALSPSPGPDLELLYREVLADDQASLGLRRQVVMLYARTFPATARPVLLPLTQGAEPELRRVAQVNLQKLDAGARPE